MKKVLAIMIIASLLTISFAVSAFADDELELSQRIPLYTVTNGTSDQVTDVLSGGSVKVTAPEGKIALIIQGSIKGLEPKTEYFVWIRDLTGYTGTSLASAPTLGYFKLAKFTTNKKGNASFHISIKRSALIARTYALQIAINKMGATSESTIVATKIAAASVVVAAK